MIIISKPTLFEAYRNLNTQFIAEDGPEFMQHFGIRGVPRVMTLGVTLVGETGFGLDPSFPFHTPQRIELLTKRYVDPVLWAESVKNLREANLKHDVWKFPPTSFNFILHRDPTLKRNPRGGGCLMGFSLTFDRRLLYVDVLSRASETVCAAYGDFMFVDNLVSTALELAGIRNKTHNVHVRWNISVAYQNSVYSPPFFVWEMGGEQFRKWVKGRGKGKTRWEQRLLKYMREVTFNPEFNQVGTRKKWASWTAAQMDGAKKARKPSAAKEDHEDESSQVSGPLH